MSLPTHQDKNDFDDITQQLRNVKQKGALLRADLHFFRESNYLMERDTLEEQLQRNPFGIVLSFIKKNQRECNFECSFRRKRIEKKRRELFKKYRCEPKAIRKSRAQFEKTLIKFDFSTVKNIYDIFFDSAGFKFHHEELINYISIHIMSLNPILINMFKLALSSHKSDENRIFICEKIKMYFDYVQALDCEPYEMFINKAFIDSLEHTFYLSDADADADAAE